MTFENQSGSSPEQDLDATEQVVDNSSKPGETEDSLLAVVQSVSEQSAASVDPASESDSPSEHQSQDEITTEQTEPESGEDFSKLPFNKHPRFRELVKEKNTYKSQMAEYEADAKQFRDIQTFMQTNDLAPQEVADALDMLARVKRGDPAEAYELMQSRMEALAVAAGKKLPDDLEQKIQEGYLDRDLAQELHQQRVAAERKAAMAETQLSRREQQDQHNSATALASAVQVWEQSTKVNDPDFDLKVDLVKDRVRAQIAANGMPRTPEEAVKLSKDAYESVTQVLRRAQGNKPSMRPAVGGKVNGSAAPEPRNLLDVIRRASAGA
jgi:hypothetical protein